MYNFIVEPKSRYNIRQIAKAVRKCLGIENAIYVNVVALLDILSRIIPKFSYEVVSNNVFPKKVFATTDVNTGKIKIKQSIYNKACDGDGFARFTIAHEIGHFVLLVLLGFELTQTLSGRKPKPFCDPEWQAECFAGEFLMDYDVVKDYSEDELVSNCGVTPKAARCQFKAFRKNAGGN